MPEYYKLLLYSLRCDPMKMLPTNIYRKGEKGGNLLLKYPMVWSGQNPGGCSRTEHKMKRFCYYNPYIEGEGFNILICSVSDLYSRDQGSMIALLQKLQEFLNYPQCCRLQYNNAPIENIYSFSCSELCQFD